MIAGSAYTACAGSGSTFTVATGDIPLLPLWSDGMTTINPGDPIGPSSLVDGGVVANGIPYLGTCVNTTAVGHVVGGAVQLQRSIV